MAFIATTTGTIGQVTLTDLGGKILLHPTTINLSEEFDEEEIVESESLNLAISQGYLTLTFKGEVITDPSTVFLGQSTFDSNQVDVLDIIGGTEGQGVSFNASGRLVPVDVGTGEFATLRLRRSSTIILPATFTPIIFDQVEIQNQISSLSIGGSSDVLINEDGLYLIQYEVYGSSANAFFESRLFLNGSISIPGSQGILETDPGEPSLLSRTVVSNFVNGDSIQLQLSGSNASVEPGLTLTAIKLQARGATGPQGEQGVGSGSGFRWRGTWNSSIDYVIDDVVLYAINNSVYICTQNTTPGQGQFQQPTNTSFWDPFLPQPTASADTNEYLNIYKTGVQSITSTNWVDITFDNQRKITSGLSHTLNSQNITFNTDGTYFIKYFITTDNSNGTRRETEVRLLQDSGAGFNEVPGSRGTIYNRNNVQGSTTATVSVLIDVNVGDIFKVQALANSGTTNITTVPNACGFIALKAVGQKGDQGIPGIGSTIVVTDDGSNVGGGSFNVLNFIGGPPLVDQNNGTVDITLPDTPIYGSEYFYDENDVTRNITSTAFTNAQLFSPSLQGGTYKVEWTYCWRFSQGSNDIETEFRINGTNAFPSSHRQEPQDTGTNQRYWTSVTKDIILSSGVNDFQISTRSTNGSTAQIFYSNIRITRVA